MDYKYLSAAESEARATHTKWGCLTWLANAELGNAEGLTLGRVVIKAGQCNPRHAHGNCEEALYLMKGRLEHSVGAESVTLEAGDTLTVAAGVFHHAINIGDEDADMIVVYSSASREFQPEG